MPPCLWNFLCLMGWQGNLLLSCTTYPIFLPLKNKTVKTKFQNWFTAQFLYYCTTHCILLHICPHSIRTLNLNVSVYCRCLDQLEFAGCKKSLGLELSGLNCRLELPSRPFDILAHYLTSPNFSCFKCQV